MNAPFCPTCGQLRPPLELFDHERHTVAGRHLRPMEWAIVALLKKRMGQYVPYDLLIDEMYRGCRDSGTMTTLRTHVHITRRALVGSGYRIVTQPKIGLKLEWSGDV